MTEERDLQAHIACPLCGGMVTATRTDWECGTGHRGPNLTLVSVHNPTCVEARNLVAAGMGQGMPAFAASEYALPHSCLPGGYAGKFVIQTEVLVAPHAFNPGKMSKGRQALCADCRNPRGGHPL